MAGLWWKTPLKWMISGGKPPYFWNHPFVLNFGNPTPGRVSACGWNFFRRWKTHRGRLGTDWEGAPRWPEVARHSDRTGAETSESVGHGMPWDGTCGWRLGDFYGDFSNSPFWRPKLLHHWKLTWNPKMKVWKMISLFKQVICRFHVNVPGCTPYQGFIHYLKLLLELSYQKDLGIFLEWRLDSTERKNSLECLGSEGHFTWWYPCAGDLAGDAEAQLVRKIASVDHHLPEPW